MSLSHNKEKITVKQIKKNLLVEIAVSKVQEPDMNFPTLIFLGLEIT